MSQRFFRNEFLLILIKSRTPWTELKPTSSPTITPGKVDPTNNETAKNEREAKDLFTTTRNQDALSKWTQNQFKDNLKDIDGREKI
jgi:hypothetical protein